MRFTTGALILAAILVVTAAPLAQERQRQPQPRDTSQYLVSAKPGVASIVVGEATVTHALPFASPDMLISGDELKTGDVVKTGATGRVEILLNPGCYLRLGYASGFVFLFDEMNSSRIKLLGGSAVIEAAAIDSPLLVETPKSRFEIIRAGLYRVNVETAGGAGVLVRKGRVLVGETTIKQGKQATVEAGAAAIAKLNPQTDDLDSWSKDRAKALIAANTNLSNRTMRRTLGIRSIFNAWIYDPFCRCYTFLPCTSGFSSPYGWDYAVYNPFWYLIPWRDYNNNGGWHPGNGGSRGGGSGSSGGSNGGNTGGGSGGHTSPPPPPPPPVFREPPSGVGGARGADREMPAPIHRRP